jgi:hypothetical protein
MIKVLNLNNLGSRWWSLERDIRYSKKMRRISTARIWSSTLRIIILSIRVATRRNQAITQ